MAKHRGYKSLKVVEEPLLVSPGYEYTWSPGININQQGPGFHIVPEIDRLVSLGYFPSGSDIAAEIIPFGESAGQASGTIACRSAIISGLFSGGETCDLCKTAQANRVLSYSDPKNKSSRMVLTCDECTKKALRLDRSKRLRDDRYEQVLDKLASKYNAEIMPLPEPMIVLRQRRGK